MRIRRPKINNTKLLQYLKSLSFSDGVVCWDTDTETVVFFDREPSQAELDAANADESTIDADATTTAAIDRSKVVEILTWVSWYDSCDTLINHPQILQKYKDIATTVKSELQQKLSVLT